MDSKEMECAMSLVQQVADKIVDLRRESLISRTSSTINLCILFLSFNNVEINDQIL
jgi:hypothetical protein